MGAASWMTRSTSPQSMPRSSVEVQTTARSSPRAIAASTLRRCSAASEPWCRAMGRLSSFSRHSSWKANSAWQRVLTKTSAVRRLLDGLVDLGHGVLGGVAGPRHLALGQQHVDHRRRAGLARGTRSTRRRRSPSRRSSQRRDHVRIVHRRRQAHPAQPRRELLQPRQAQRQQVAALGGVDGVDLVEDHAASGPRNSAARPPRRRTGPAARAWSAGCRAGASRWRCLLATAGVAGAALDTDRQPHLADRRHQVALHVDRQRLQRRDVEGVDAAPGRMSAAARSASSIRLGRKPARVLPPAGRRDQQGVRPGSRRRDHLQLVPRGAQPRRANQSAKRGGSWGESVAGAGGGVTSRL